MWKVGVLIIIIALNSFALAGRRGELTSSKGPTTSTNEEQRAGEDEKVETFTLRRSRAQDLTLPSRSLTNTVNNNSLDTNKDNGHRFPSEEMKPAVTTSELQNSNDNTNPNRKFSNRKSKSTFSLFQGKSDTKEKTTEKMPERQNSNGITNPLASPRISRLFGLGTDNRQPSPRNEEKGKMKENMTDDPILPKKSDSSSLLTRSLNWSNKLPVLQPNWWYDLKSSQNAESSVQLHLKYNDPDSPRDVDTISLTLDIQNYILNDSANNPTKKQVWYRVPSHGLVIRDKVKAVKLSTPNGSSPSHIIAPKIHSLAYYPLKESIMEGPRIDVAAVTKLNIPFVLTAKFKSDSNTGEDYSVRFVAFVDTIGDNSYLVFPHPLLGFQPSHKWIFEIPEGVPLTPQALTHIIQTNPIEHTVFFDMNAKWDDEVHITNGMLSDVLVLQNKASTVRNPILDKYDVMEGRKMELLRYLIASRVRQPNLQDPNVGYLGENDPFLYTFLCSLKGVALEIEQLIEELWLQFTARAVQEDGRIVDQPVNLPEDQAAILDRKKKVVNFFYLWVTVNSNVLFANERTVQFLKDVVTNLNEDDSDSVEHAKSVMTAVTSLYNAYLINLDKQAKGIVQIVFEQGGTVGSFLLRKLLPTDGTYISGLMELTPLSVVNWLTDLEFKLLKLIPEFELLFNTPTNTPSKNLLKFIQNFNQISRWVATEVLSGKTARDRAKHIKFFIDAAEVSRTKNNMSLTFAIMSGLANASVVRLKLTWDEVGTKAMRRYDSLLELVNGEFNYRIYYKEVQGLKPPYILYMGKALGDIAFAIEKNPFLRDNKNVNGYTINLLAEYILNFKYGLSQEMNIDKATNPSPEAVAAYFRTVPYVIGDKYFDELSQMREPRVRTIPNQAEIVQGEKKDKAPEKKDANTAEKTSPVLENTSAGTRPGLLSLESTRDLWRANSQRALRERHESTAVLTRKDNLPDNEPPEVVDPRNEDESSSSSNSK